MRIVVVVGTRPQLIKAAALSPVLRRHHELASSTPASTTTRRWPGRSSASSASPLRTMPWASAAARTPTRPRAMLIAPRADRCVDRRPDAVLVYGDTNSTLAGALAGGQARLPGRARRGGPAQLRPADARRDQPHRGRPPRAPAVRADADRGRQPARPKASTTGVTLVGDLMQDLAARIGREVRDPPRTASIAAAGWRARPRARRVPLRDGPPRREPRARPCAPGRPARRCRAAERPVILAIHPGTARRARALPASRSGRTSTSSSRRATGPRSPSSSTPRRC